MKVFGPSPWGPALDGCPMVETPVGELCMSCREPIVEGDSGVIMPLLGPPTCDSCGRMWEGSALVDACPVCGGLVTPAREVAQHRECHMRSVLGSVAHQAHACSCHGGVEAEEPPGLSKREAARAAVEFATRRGSMTDREIEQRYPWVPWREPLPVKMLDATAEGFACRLCVAKEGLRGADVRRLAQTREEFDQHMKERHP